MRVRLIITKWVKQADLYRSRYEEQVAVNVGVIVKSEFDLCGNIISVLVLMGQQDVHLDNGDGLGKFSVT